MPLAAILNATAVSGDKTDILRGQLIFASQMLIEYQARQAAHAGAQAIFIMVDQVTPIWSRMVDRLIGEGLDVHLMRDMASLVRLFPRDSDALLFADGMVVDQRYVSELGKAEGDALLVVGAPNSSNSRRLVEVAAREGCARAVLVQRAGEIDWAALSGIRTLGLTAGASAPEELVNEVIAALRDRFEVTVQPVETVVERVEFKVPRVLREPA